MNTREHKEKATPRNLQDSLRTLIMRWNFDIEVIQNRLALPISFILAKETEIWKL